MSSGSTDVSGRRSEEQIEVLRALWTGQPASFTGRWHRFENAGISPMPVQRPIPIWIGSHGDAGLRRLGRLADGWMPVAASIEEVEKLAAKREVVDLAARSAGRNPASIGVDAQVVFNWIPESGWREYALAWQAFGATHLTVTTMGLNASSVEEHLATLRFVRDELRSAGVANHDRPNGNEPSERR